MTCCERLHADVKKSSKVAPYSHLSYVGAFFCSCGGGALSSGLSLLTEQMPAEALAAFSSAASLGHPAAHAAAAALHFEGAVGRDGTVIDGDNSKAHAMCAALCRLHTIVTRTPTQC